MSRMTGYAPVNQVYGFANGHFAPGALVLYITRCKYATLARMARNAGDLPLAGTRKLRTRLKTLIAWGLVRYSSTCRRYELTAAGWNLLVQTEATYALQQEARAS